MMSSLVFLSAIFISAHAQFLLSGLIRQPGSTNPDIANTDSSTYRKPAFCKKLDCPKFRVIETNDKFEVRQYEPSVWVATNKPMMQYTRAESRTMFYKLFNYISGNNTQAMKIPMTAPVVTEIDQSQGPFRESNFTRHFMMPHNLQVNPPAPTDPTVYIKRMPAKTFYVKTYGGFSNDWIKRQKMEELVGDLTAANRMYEDQIYYTAGYDGPYSFTNRHNEIWIAAN